ncbi:MAG: MinD/ParA family protein [Leptospiraceae bacterium]|nr:MinD/ParA family protein [Leptospiraceae bacterium]MCP5497512.1 MinD/ParA family protein [Leptospiraceae bacterium]
MDQAENLRKLKEKAKKFQPIPMNGKSKTRIIAITSGKGGVGKSTFSVNLGISLAREGKKVLVLDGDFGLANINVLFGIIPQYNLYHVVKGHKSLQDIIISTQEGIDIIPGANGYTQLANLDDEKRNSLIQNFSFLDNYDYIFIDTGGGISSNVIGLIMASDEVIVITTPEPTSITDSYGLIKSVIAQEKEKKLSLVVNRAKDEKEGKKVASRLASISLKFLGVTLEEQGIIFLDEDVEKSIRAQKPLVVNYPNSKAAICIQKITQSVIHTHSLNNNEITKIGGFFNRFFNFMDQKDKQLEKNN